MKDTSLISLKNLSIAFSGKKVVDNVSFEIAPGECLALVGESGSGKSVTALSILQLLPKNITNYPSGEILYRGESLLNESEERLRDFRGNKVSIIFQEPMTSLNPLHTVEKQLAESLQLHQALKKADIKSRSLDLLELVGIPSPEKRLKQYPHELSGGLRQRVMIAMALANEPELLIADEPTTALDVTIQKQILELLRTLQTKLNMAVLLITHDLGIVKHFADRVCVMHQGKLVETQTTQLLFDQPQESYTQKLLSADPSGQAHPLTPNSPVILKVNQLDVWFPIYSGLFKRITDYHKAITGAHFELRKGETLGIVGESGSGKTTLALAVLRLIQSSGEIHFQSHALHTLKQKQVKPLRKQMQIVFQDPFGSLSPRMLVGESIAEGLEVHGVKDPNDIRRRVEEALVDVGLEPSSAERYPHEFSGGQRQRIAIARALVLRPDLIVLDEPTSALDRTVQRQIVELLRDLQKRYELSYLFISHDLSVVKALSHRVMVVKDGITVESGLTEDVFASPKHPYTQSLMKAAFALH